MRRQNTNEDRQQTKVFHKLTIICLFVQIHYNITLKLAKDASKGLRCVCLGRDELFVVLLEVIPERFN